MLQLFTMTLHLITVTPLGYPSVMETEHDGANIDQTTAEVISGRAGRVFQPRIPINRPDFFAGRWDQLTTIVDAVSQAGLHAVIYGERGVGKTSLERFQ